MSEKRMISKHEMVFDSLVQINEWREVSESDIYPHGEARHRYTMKIAMACHQWYMVYTKSSLSLSS